MRIPHDPGHGLPCSSLTLRAQKGVPRCGNEIVFCLLKAGVKRRPKISVLTWGDAAQLLRCDGQSVQRLHRPVNISGGMFMPASRLSPPPRLAAFLA